MKRNLVSLAVVFFLAALPSFGQGAPGQSNYPISQQAAAGAPSGTCPGTNVYYLNTSNGNIYTCPTPGGSWTLTGSGGSGFPVTTNQTVNTGGSITPSGVGQDAASQVWMNGGVSSGVSNAVGLNVVVNATGGSLTSGSKFIVAWFNTAAGSTYTSYQAAPSMGICTTTCSITISEPAPVVAGMTSWSVGDGTVTGGPYLTNSACTNVPIATTTCTITANGAGAAVPIVNTAWVQPPNVQTNECPLGIIPTIFTQDMAGNYHTAGGVDQNSNNGITSGFLTFCRHMRFTDQQTEAPYGNNAAWMFNHFAGVGISTANQDRNVWMNTQTPANDSAARYGVENLQAETDFNCNGCTITGSPDGDVETGSFQLSDNMLTNPSPAGGIQTLRVNYTRTATAAAYFSGASAVNATWGPGSATGFTGGSIGNVYYAQCQNNSASTIPNLTCAAFDALFPANPNHYANGQIALWNRSSGSYTPGANDFIIRSDILGETTALNGPVLFTALQSSNGGSAALTGTASLNLTGGFATTQATALTTPAGTCSGGASNYTYELVGVDVNGGLVPGSIVATGASCTNPLTSGNPVTLSISLSSAAIEPFIRIDVYRTGGPMGTGKIGSLTCQQNGVGPNCNTFSDTGLTASGSAPTVNSTGTLAVAGALISNGTAAALTGTGACATITTQTGGAFAGSAKCTGTTGASTLTITPGLTAPNGWSCNVQDETTRANAFQQTSHTTTTCVLTVTSVTANDVFVFSALAF